MVVILFDSDSSHPVIAVIRHIDDAIRIDNNSVWLVKGCHIPVAVLKGQIFSGYPDDGFHHHGFGVDHTDTVVAAIAHIQVSIGIETDPAYLIKLRKMKRSVAMTGGANLTRHPLVGGQLT